jgi:hypothetical protein
MDVPINLLQWEVFLPEQYKVKDFSGDAIATSLLPPSPIYAAAESYDRAAVVAMNAPVSQSETVQVMTETTEIRVSERNEREARKNAEKQQMAASSNVTNLQQRVSGILPVRVDVPRAGNSYHFVRPLVLDEETKVTFTYKSK